MAVKMMDYANMEHMSSDIHFGMRALCVNMYAWLLEIVLVKVFKNI